MFPFLLVQLLSPVLFFCNPVDHSPPVSSVCGISQARILEWIAISFSSRPSWPQDQTCIYCIAGGFFTTESPGLSTRTVSQFSESPSNGDLTARLRDYPHTRFIILVRVLPDQWAIQFQNLILKGLLSKTIKKKIFFLLLSSLYSLSMWTLI